MMANRFSETQVMTFQPLSSGRGNHMNSNGLLQPSEDAGHSSRQQEFSHGDARMLSEEQVYAM